MVNISRISVLAILFCISLSHVNASESAVETFNRLYRNGDYKHAFNKLTKQRKSLAKKGLSNSAEYALTFFEEALLVHEYDEVSLDSSIAIFGRGFEIAKEYPEMFVEGQVLCSKLYRNFGWYAKSDSILNEVNINEEHPAFFRKHHELVELHFAQGKYTLAIEEIRKEERHYFDHIEEKIAGLGKKTTKDVARINRYYGDLGNLEAKILLEKGDVHEAKRVIDKNNKWLELHGITKDVVYLDNIYVKGLYYMKKHDWRQAYLQFEKFFENIETTKYGYKYKEGADAYFDNLEALVITLYEDNRKLEAQHHIAAYASPVWREFGTNSKRAYKLELLEVKKMMIEKEFADALKVMILLEDKLSDYPKDHPFRRELLNEKYVAQLQMDDYKGAERSLEKLEAIGEIQFDDKSPKYHLDQLEKAVFLTSYSNDLETARKIYSKSYEGVLNKELGPYHPGFFKAQNEMAKLYILDDEYSRAEKVLKPAMMKSLKVFGFRDHRYARQLSEYASLLMKQGDYAKSYELLEESAAVYEVNDYNSSQLGYADMLKTQARLFILLGSYNDAKDKLGYAKQILKKYKDSDRDIIEFAELFIKQGEFHKVEKVLFQTIDHQKELYGIKYSGLIDNYNNLAKLYIIAGEYVKAEDYSFQATELAKEIYGAESFKYAESVKVKGDIHQAYGDYEEAIKLFATSIEVQEAIFGSDHLIAAITLMDKAIAEYYLNKDMNAVQKSFSHVFKVIENSFRNMDDSSKFNYGKNNPFYADALKNLAFFQIENGEYAAADKSLEMADRIWVKKSKLGRVNINSADVLLLRGSIAKYQGKSEKAIDYYTKASTYYKKIFNPLHPKYAYSLSKLGQMYYINGDYKKAVKTLNNTTKLYLTFIESYFPSLSEREKNKYWSLIKNDFEFFNTLVVEHGSENPELVGQAYNNILATKALLLNSSIKMRESIMKSGDAYLINLFNQWVEKRELLVAVLSMSPDQLSEEGVNPESIEQELNALEKELSSRSKEFQAEAKQYTWQEVQQVLGTGEAAIEFVRFRKYNTDFSDTIFYAAFIVDKTTSEAPKMVVLDNGNELESKMLSYYKNTVKLNLVDETPYQKFWEPVENKIKGSKRLYVSLDGVYNQINIETLKSPAGYVLDQYGVVVMSNTKELLSKNNSVLSSRPKAIFVGNPAFYKDAPADTRRSVKELPGAEAEVVLLSKFMDSKKANVKSYLKEEATEEAIKEGINSFNPEILHIASHGFFIDSDEKSSELEALNESKSVENAYYRSGIMLVNAGKIISEEKTHFQNYNKEDGILTAYEAKNLKLDSAIMVVLSACETGVGKVQNGEGVAGLLSAFLTAGADNVIISLFKVSDQVTTDLMDSYYKNLFTSSSEREAFIKAKKEIREKYKSPIYWGAFVMVSS